MSSSLPRNALHGVLGAAYLLAVLRHAALGGSGTAHCSVPATLNIQVLIEIIISRSILNTIVPTSIGPRPPRKTTGSLEKSQIMCRWDLLF